MKKAFYILPLLGALFFGLSSCSSEKEVDSGFASTGNTVSFTIEGCSPATRATPVGSTTVPTTALDREKAIESIYAVVFKKGGGFYKTFKAVPEGSAAYKFDMLQEGEFDVYLVANPDATLQENLKGIKDLPAELARLIVKQSPGEDNNATNFLMTAEKFAVTAGGGRNFEAGKILLTRAAARFDIYNRVEGLKMTKITFKNRPVETSIAEDILLLTQNKTYEAAQGLKSKECLASIYSYGYTMANRCTLTLEGTFNDKPFTPHDIVINTPVNRNHLYNIVISNEGGSVTPGDPGKLKIQIKFKDWDDETIEWKGDQLIDKSAPGFTVTGTGVTTIPAASNSIPVQNPTEVIIGEYTATNLTVSVTSASSLGSNLVALSTLPTGYTITAGAVGNKDGKLTQEFTIHLAQNLETEKLLNFRVFNAFSYFARQDFTVKQKGKMLRPKLAIEYVAEYNIGTTPGEFATSHDNDKSGYYKWEEAKEASLMPQDYHLPSLSEWAGIFSKDGHHVIYDGRANTDDVLENITIKGETKPYHSDYHSNKEGVCYALRFKSSDKSMLCAYRYERVGDMSADNLKDHLKVTVRYLGESFKGSIATIETEDFWKKNTSEDIIRIFPACGHDAYGTPTNRGTGGYYRSSTANSDTYGKYIEFGLFDAKVVDGEKYSATHGHSVRPFSDK